MSNPDRAFWLLAAAVGLGVAYAMWKKPHVLSDVEQTVSGTVSTIFQHTPDVPAVANTDPAQARPGISGATLSF